MDYTNRFLSTTFLNYNIQTRKVELEKCILQRQNTLILSELILTDCISQLSMSGILTLTHLVISGAQETTPILLSGLFLAQSVARLSGYLYPALFYCTVHLVLYKSAFYSLNYLPASVHSPQKRTEQESHLYKKIKKRYLHSVLRGSGSGSRR